MLRSKSSFRLAAHTLLLMLLIAMAAVSPATALDFAQSSSGDFCSTLDARRQRIDGQIGQVQAEVRQSWQQQNDRLKVMVSEQRSSSQDLSHAVDVQRSHNLNRLRQSATTSNERRAVDSYIATQKQANDGRRNSIAVANGLFTNALKRYIGNRQAAQAGQVEALRINLDDELQTASGQCATGVSDKDVASEFTKSIQASRQTYLLQRKSDTAIVAQVQDLSATRRQTASAVNQTYSATMAEARQRLTAAIK